MKGRSRNPEPVGATKIVEARTARACAVTALSVLFVAVGIPVGVYAQTSTTHIFKCMQGETIAYQSMPCGEGQTEVKVLTMARAEANGWPPGDAVARVAPEVPTAPSSARIWPPHGTLTLGMSDDEVLNLAGWGIPKHIARTKAARGWREEWTYVTSAGERRLYFVNSILVDAIVDGDGNPTTAQVVTARRSYPAS